MSPTYFFTLIIFVPIVVILAGTWLLLRRSIKDLQRISNRLEITINKLEEWKHRWIY